MTGNYFKRIYELTGTKLWINNVTREEAKLALSAGALGCTQNPSYTYKMLTHPTEAAYAKALLKEALVQSADPNEVQCILQAKLIKGISDIFMPSWESSYGKFGYVSIQGDPIHEESAKVIIDEGRRNREINPNVMIKIPATKAGLDAMKILVEENTPINATEVMGVSQALEICRMYRSITSRTGKFPAIYYSLITGIFDEYIQKIIKDKNIQISRDIVYIAGVAVAQKTYRLTKAHYPEIGFIGGGVRGLHHFTEMVGGDVCITMNWQGQAEELISRDYPVVPRFFNPISEYYLDELLTKIPEFKMAYMENGLKIEEYEHYGPVEYFRHMFVSAWQSANAIINEEKTSLKE